MKPMLLRHRRLYPIKWNSIAVVTLLVISVYSASYAMAQKPTSSENSLEGLKVEFISLSVTQAIGFGSHHLAGGDWQVGAGVTHEGVVKVTPSSAKEHITLRLLQTLNSEIVTGAVAGLTDIDSREDSVYNGRQQDVVTDGDNMSISSDDGPGPSGPEALWRSAVPSTGSGSGLTNVNVNFNLYLQYATGPDGVWKTVGKVKWGLHGWVSFDNVSANLIWTGTGSTSASGTPLVIEAGAASKQEPLPPASPN